MKRLLVILFLFLSLGGGAAMAQPADNAADKKDGWEKVDGSMMAPGESIPASTLVGAAYGFIFLALLVWVGSVAARTRRVEEEVASLRQKLKK
jgi:hypothetical protein